MESLAEFTAGLLRTSAPAYARAAMRSLAERQSFAADLTLPEAFASPVEDLEVRLLHLAAAIQVDQPELFADALCWQKVALHHRRVPPSYLSVSSEAARRALRDELPSQCIDLVERHWQHADEAAAAAPTELPCALSAGQAHEPFATCFLQAVLAGSGDDAVDLFRAALHRGTSLDELHDRVLTPVLRELGRRWLMAEVPVVAEHYGSATIDRCLHLLRERLPRPAADAPRVLALGVGGNLHDFGLRMLGQRLQQQGFAVVDLGANMPGSDVVWALQGRSVDLIAISAALLMQLPELQDMVAAIRRRRDRATGAEVAVPILVGGRLFERRNHLHRRIGADAVAHDVASGVEQARRLLAC